MKSAVVEKDEIKVVCVRAEGGIEGAKQAFSKLESYFTSIRGRKFYGVVLGDEYLACTRIEKEDDPKSLRLETYKIPRGFYATSRLKNWTQRVKEIAPTFRSLMESHETDKSRPLIEFYKSFSELVLRLPIVEKER